MPLRFDRWPNQVHQPTERLLSYCAPTALATTAPSFSNQTALNGLPDRPPDTSCTVPTRHPDSYVTQPSWPFQAHTPNFFQPMALSLLYTSYTGAFSASAAPGLVGIASRKDSISGLAILSRGNFLSFLSS